MSSAGSETNVKISRSELIDCMVCMSNIELCEHEVEILKDNNSQRSNIIEIQDEELKEKDRAIFWRNVLILIEFGLIILSLL